MSQEIERRLRLLTQRQTQRVLLTALPYRLLHILGQPIEPVSRSRPVDPLMRTLMIIIADPVIDPLTRIGERREHGLLEELTPDRLPEPLDLPQCHRMVRRASNMSDPLLLEHPLKAGLPTPGHELTAIVAENLTRCAPLSDRPFKYFQYSIGSLLTEQPPANQKTRVVVDDPDQVHAVHPLELEGEDVDLPHRVGYGPLEAPHLDRPTTRLWRWLTQIGFVDHTAHRLRAHRQPLVAP